MVHGRAQSIEIGARISIPLILFGRSIARCPQSRSLFTPGVASNIGAGNTKIDQVCSPVFATDDDVSRFDITMHNGWRLSGEIVKDIEHFGSTAKHFAFLHWLLEAIHTLFQIFPFHVLLHHEVARSFFEVIGYARNQRMVKVGQGHYFLFEVALIFLIFQRIRTVRGQFFDNNQLAIEAFISRQQCRTHSTLAKYLFNDIATTLQGGTDVKCTRSATCVRTGRCGCSNRSQSSATIATIVYPIAVFIFTVGTLHGSYLLPSLSE